MSKKIVFGNDLAKELKKYGLNKIGEVPTKYKNGITTIYYMWSVVSNIDKLGYKTPYIEYTTDEETDGFIMGTMFPQGNNGLGTQFDTFEDVKYFISHAEYNNADLTESKKSMKERSEENEIIVSELQDTVEYFCGLFEEKGELKGNALKDLKNAVERLEVFNAIGSIYQWGVEILNKCGIKYKGLKESKKSLKESIEYFVGDKTAKGFEVCMIEDGKKYYLSKLAKNIEDSSWSSDHTYAKHWKDKSRAEEIVNELNSLNESLKESKSIKEGKNVKKSLEIIRRKLMELINDDTIQEEFNEVWENNGIYDSVDDMFEVSVHNVLNSLLKENTITIIPF